MKNNLPAPNVSQSVNIGTVTQDVTFTEPKRLSAEAGEGVIKVQVSGNAQGSEDALFYRRGVIRPIYVTKIYFTDTTATGIKAWSV